METKQPSAHIPSPTWVLIRDVAALQVKLLIDGLRDFLLVPASLIAGVLSLARSEGGRPGPEFYQLLGVGRRSEHWINLFGAMQNAPPEVVDQDGSDAADMDELIGRVENYVIDEYRRGGVTAQAKDQIDKALAAIRRGRRRNTE